MAYFTKHLPDFDGEIARRVAHDKTRDWSAIRADVKFIGRFSGQIVLDVFFALPETQRPFGKMILVGNAGRFRPLVWILDDSNVQLDSSEIKLVQGMSILSTRCRVAGAGNAYIEDYFVLNPHAPTAMNLRPEIEAAITAEEKSLLPAGCSVSKGGGFDLSSLKYVNPVWKAGDANCCPSCGRLEITFNLKGGHLVKNEARHDPKFKWH
ncbi:MAG TPA: hypothetical protein VF331_14215 [Polyangiales bacterium]